MIRDWIYFIIFCTSIVLITIYISSRPYGISERTNEKLGMYKCGSACEGKKE